MEPTPEQIRTARRTEIWRKLPVTAGTVLAINIFPVLIFWMFPEWRTLTTCTLWVLVTTLLAAVGCIFLGPYKAGDRMIGTELSPAQAGIAVVINVAIIGAALWTMGHFGPAH